MPKVGQPIPKAQGVMNSLEATVSLEVGALVATPPWKLSEAKVPKYSHQPDRLTRPDRKVPALLYGPFAIWWDDYETAYEPEFELMHIPTKRATFCSPSLVDVMKFGEMCWTLNSSALMETTREEFTRKTPLWIGKWGSACKNSKRYIDPQEFTSYGVILGAS